MQCAIFEYLWVNESLKMDYAPEGKGGGHGRLNWFQAKQNNVWKNNSKFKSNFVMI